MTSVEEGNWLKSQADGVFLRIRTIWILYRNVREESKFGVNVTVSQGVTRLEIAEAVAQAFGERGATRGEIVEAARTAGRQEIVDVLEELPDRRYGRLNDLWEDLYDVPLGV